jgi:hypothetical protein
MDLSLGSEPGFDMEAYIAWASQFVDFELGERAAEAFRGPIPDTSNLEEAAPAAAAALSGFWDQQQAHNLWAGGRENPGDAPDVAAAELWQMFGLNPPATQLELPPLSHTSDYSDFTMRDDLQPALGLELPPGPGSHSDITSKHIGEVPSHSASRINQVELIYGTPITQASPFCPGPDQPPPSRAPQPVPPQTSPLYAPPTLNKNEIFAQYPRWAAMYEDIITFAQGLMLCLPPGGDTTLWARNEGLWQASHDSAAIIGHPLYSIASAAVGVFRDESEDVLEVPAYDSK